MHSEFRVYENLNRFLLNRLREGVGCNAFALRFIAYRRLYARVNVGNLEFPVVYGARYRI